MSNAPMMVFGAIGLGFGWTVCWYCGEDLYTRQFVQSETRTGEAYDQASRFKASIIYKSSAA